MPELSPELRTLRSRIAAHKSWGVTEDRSARTAKARKAFEDKFLAEAGGDPKRAESLRKEYYARLAFQSAKARRKASETTSEARAQDEFDRAAAQIAEIETEFGGGAA